MSAGANVSDGTNSCLSDYSVAIVEYGDWEPDLHSTPDVYKIVETYAEGLDYETAEAIAIGKSFDLMRDPTTKRWAVALPPGAITASDQPNEAIA
ncbi:MAG: hypothetical protein ISR77_16645 [Pirellulaceae bacterium]|nr:hypothetical protein [Pirellulaceae bacterium]